jgi:hypothetical protein
MKPRVFPDNQSPYFSWDRPLTAGDIRRKLRNDSGPEKIRTMAWILREATPRDVWAFIALQEVAADFDKIEPMLGRTKPLWRYLIRTWRELGAL